MNLSMISVEKLSYFRGIGEPSIWQVRACQVVALCLDDDGRFNLSRIEGNFESLAILFGGIRFRNWQNTFWLLVAEKSDRDSIVEWLVVGLGQFPEDRVRQIDFDSVNARARFDRLKQVSRNEFKQSDREQYIRDRYRV